MITVNLRPDLKRKRARRPMQGLLEGIERLPRAVAGRGRTNHLRRTIDVETVRVFRSKNVARL